MTKRGGIRFFLAVWSVLSLVAFAEPSNDCSGRWRLFSSVPNVQGAFPDTHVSYWRYIFQWDPAHPFVLRVSGGNPAARYFSFNLYDQSSGNTLSSLSDEQIARLPQSPGSSPGRGYFFPTILSPDNTNSEALSLPSSFRSPGVLELWYRLYLPENFDPGTYEETAGPVVGNVPLPRLESFGLDGRPAPCPQEAPPLVLTPLQWAARAAEVAVPYNPTRSEIDFYATRGLGLFPNGDTYYLTTPVPRSDITVVKFRPPSMAATANSKADVRYWSLCVGRETTRVHDCLADRDATVGPGGWVTVVLSHQGADFEGVNLKARVEKEGMNFLGWNFSLRRVIIYRQLLPHLDFEGSILRVPVLPPRDERPENFDSAPYASVRHLGDYAPRGRTCSFDQFKRDRCGL